MVSFRRESPGTQRVRLLPWRFFAALAALVAVTAPVFICPAVSQAKETSAKRPFGVEDTFQLEGLGNLYGGPYAFSADGRQLAMTRLRSSRLQSNFKWQWLWGNARADVWVQLDPSGTLTNITNGALDGSGWWAPAWSPDGKLLAMLSTRGGNVRIWVWNPKDNSLKPLSSRGVELADPYARPLAWIDSRHLIFNALPPGDKPKAMTAETRTQASASQQWVKEQEGKTPTASVLESGVPVDISSRPQTELTLVDVSNQDAKTIARGVGRTWSISPPTADGRVGRNIAFTRLTTVYLPQADQPIALDFSGKSAIALSTTDGASIPLATSGNEDVLEDSVRWSSDGRRVAYLSFEQGRARPPVLRVLDAATGVATLLSLNGIDPTPPNHGSPGIEWTGSGAVIVQAVKIDQAARPNANSRRDWWLTSESKAPKAITAVFKQPPDILLTAADRHSFVALADNDLWRIDPITGRVARIAPALKGPVQSIVWPARPHAYGPRDEPMRGAAYSEIIVAVGGGEYKAPILVRLVDGALTPIDMPDSRAEIVDYTPQTRSLILRAADQTGLEMWRGKVGARNVSLLFQANQFLSNIESASFKSISYKSLTGADLKGWLMLPPDYQPNRRYPMITWVYPGTVYGSKGHGNEIDEATPNPLNLQIAAAKGFVILLPSMPTPPAGVADDPMLRLPDGVLPAVDQAIAMGIADPARLYLMGASFGGFATYGLVTQTSRFKAAVAIAGLSDLVSLYGIFEARERYDDYPQEQLFQPWQFENGQVAMGVPPWKDPVRYYRNSPINFVDRVTTPLMIIQGDIDYVPLQQGEEFFTSLYRQGKRAEFVRYWGEGHIPASPANIEDLWTRIFAWFDEFGTEATSVPIDHTSPQVAASSSKQP
jgi:dipeptidyl aminopeptidase/acylaminoacyl peptidase